MIIARNECVVLCVAGSMAKALHSAGGGSNYLCLPLAPEFLPGSQAGFQSGAEIYGVEYENGDTPVAQFPANHDAPCVVCEVRGQGQVLMIPARVTCPTDWRLEYSGVLMSQHKTHQSSEFVCVSLALEAGQAGRLSKAGGSLYVVEAKCGSLPCPPYTDGYEIACVVCTKE